MKLSEAMDVANPKIITPEEQEFEEHKREDEESDRKLNTIEVEL